MLELKPCPFCGGEAKLIEGSYSEDGRFDRAWIVYCKSCDARIFKLPDWSNWNPYHERYGVCEAAMRNAIIEAWNKRHTTVAASGKVSEDLMKRILAELSKDGGKDE